MRILTNYQDLAVRLTDERLAHVLEHPEMAGTELAVEETLRSPQTVVQSFTDPQAQLYYRPYTHPRLGDKLICIVVKVQASDAFVLTAYLTDRAKKGVTLWPRRS